MGKLKLLPCRGFVSFSSLSETQGIVLLESMAAGTPVLAVRGTGTEDVVANGMNGYMTEVSETEFAGKLMDILEKKEIDLLRQGALLTARNYGSEKIARQAALVYAQAACNRRERTERNTAIGMEEKIWYTLDDIDCGGQK